jgi:hypothetical protein
MSHPPPGLGGGVARTGPPPGFGASGGGGGSGADAAAAGGSAPAGGGANQGNPAAGANGTAAIVRAQIVFLLTTFTEDSFDKAASEIRTVRYSALRRDSCRCRLSNPHCHSVARGHVEMVARARAHARTRRTLQRREELRLGSHARDRILLNAMN